jgi:hypothetical protein
MVLMSYLIISNAIRSDLVKESARKEFELNRFVSDPETVARLLVVARDAIFQVKQKVDSVLLRH